MSSLLKKSGLVLALLAIVALAGSGIADDKKPAPAKPDESKKAEGAKKTEEAKSGTPEMNAEMEAWMKAMAVGPEHNKMAAMVGKWDHVSKHRMAPEAPWEESKGTTEFKSMMGGRFIAQDVKAPPMFPGTPPFEGFGLSGFDNVTKKYVSIWVDNLGTGMMVSYGTADATGNVVTYASEYPDPMTGKMKKIKSITRFKDAKSHAFEMYDTGADGKEYMMFEVTYTKK